MQSLTTVSQADTLPKIAWEDFMPITLADVTPGVWLVSEDITPRRRMICRHENGKFLTVSDTGHVMLEQLRATEVVDNYRTGWRVEKQRG